MKLFSISTVAVLLAQSASGFAPMSQQASFGVVSPRGSVLQMAKNPVPFFAQDSDDSSEDTESVDDSVSFDDEVEILVQAEMAKNEKVSNLRNAKGVDYAPWMNISADDESKIRQLVKEKAEVRRKRAEQEKDVSGNLFTDSQAQELSGTGLNYKVIDGQVELEWATKSESNTKGFIVKRRIAKTNEFSILASYKEWGPLASQGIEGGVYRYLDNTVSPGGWVYRITECDNSGSEADLCQCLVDVQTEDEQKQAVILGVGFGIFAIAAVVAGLVLDPLAG
eukprot:CAMPEP_0197833334 /NCGR_PEP_ID=MMETSP1437-20131217/18683_1 /TAXON_ID=49252 ORGANISM="Eucampia antarctica, Strain CCMP1452" /NCGR_SAMPLE_ID=MMETSP1437 /ASSEMBLY_ACC=CAM_ASM_001096 /LENGTH=279 /DNA_ID=CAMNT_0043437323 /DNA_START=37 /DNA_END=876 /DNA_ORIENTATION=+